MSPDPIAGEPDPDFQPEATRTIGDVDTLRAISDPTRLRILETLVTRTDPAWSVKEIAAALGVPQTRLYHHIDLLLQHDLVRAVERRVVSGIIETRYRVAAMSFQLDRGLLAGGSEDGRRVLHDTLVTVFDTARDELERAITLGLVDTVETAPVERRALLSRGLARLTPARAAELRGRLKALEDEFGSDAPGEGDQAYGVVLAVYPVPPATEPSDD